MAENLVAWMVKRMELMTVPTTVLRLVDVMGAVRAVLWALYWGKRWAKQ